MNLNNNNTCEFKKNCFMREHEFCYGFKNTGVKDFLIEINNQMNISNEIKKMFKKKHLFYKKKYKCWLL